MMSTSDLIDPKAVPSTNFIILMSNIIFYYIIAVYELYLSAYHQPNLNTYRKSSIKMQFFIENAVKWPVYKVQSKL